MVHAADEELAASISVPSVAFHVWVRGSREPESAVE